MKDIVFVVNSIADNHWQNRVAEFVYRGYNPIIYAFSRNEGYKTYEKEWPVKVLADFPNTLSYSKRIRLFIRYLREVVKDNRGKDVVFYFFGLDLAMFVVPFIKQPYIYEEFDMMHNYIKNVHISRFMEWLDKRFIKKSVLALLTSEGFIEYHFGNRCPKNVVVVPNRLNPDVEKFPYHFSNIDNASHLRFAFVGSPRAKTMVNFARIIAEQFPNHEMHFYGKIGLEDEYRFVELQDKNNIFFHGYFKNPDDLPDIYNNIDILVAAYDADYENVRYAEPNKIYEAVYFEKPIIVSSRTFLARKVKRMRIGWDLNTMNDDEVIQFIKGLSINVLNDKKEQIRKYEKREQLNINNELFNRLNSLL